MKTHLFGLWFIVLCMIISFSVASPADPAALAIRDNLTIGCFLKQEATANSPMSVVVAKTIYLGKDVLLAKGTFLTGYVKNNIDPFTLTNVDWLISIDKSDDTVVMIEAKGAAFVGCNIAFPPNETPESPVTVILSRSPASLLKEIKARLTSSN